ncbi:Uncharacterized protein ALO70_05746 [Pseudomonas amygdali pv. eriobotryae]|uniref:Uncharacterized protein n=1 Tax=Pseudomonas amygdali pv. eriobotryae TaxID=129137 RepID=A0A0P9TCR5_PSEA0|nr:Uncharacterized protein ALO70_05746 [Pseudomonas amygdali pv. eriobotryae]RMO55592.1 hypothetical protein ALQ39_05742 [Pseudomonas amygdali pv. eriobotryae]
MLDVLQVGTHGQPVGNVEAVVDFRVVLSALDRQVARVVVVVDAADLVGQTHTILHIVVDVDTGDTDTDVIFRTRVERTFVRETDLLVVIDEVGGLVVHGSVGKNAQAARCIAIVSRQLLLSNNPPAVLAVMRLERSAGSCLWLTVNVFIDIVGVGRALVEADTVFTGQRIDGRGPDQFNRQDHTFGAAAAEFEAVTGFEVGRVLLIDADLCIHFRRDVVLHAQGPLADWPVVPGVHIVTDLRAAERQVLEIAREAVEVFARSETTSLDVQRAVKVLLLDPHLRQTPGLAATPDFLGGTEGTGTRVADPVVGDVAPATFGDCQLELCILPAESLLQIDFHAQRELVAVAAGLVVVVTALDVAGHLGNVFQREVIALVEQFGTLAVPVAGHPR